MGLHLALFLALLFTPPARGDLAHYQKHLKQFNLSTLTLSDLCSGAE
ncbi:MAG: hypothetical protein H7333_02225 [Bdellovibrionales bacterium]|nr:hypothetical protein [Oligoflexia bacterium]